MARYVDIDELVKDLKESDLTTFSQCIDFINNYPADEELYTREQVQTVKRGACRDGQKGYGPYDIVIEDYI